MENSEVFDEKIDLSSNGHMLSSCSFKESEIISNESVFYEKFLLDDLDNYWDELNDRLTVSRMVNDSVIKGMVRAVVEESDEKIASKEEQIASLNQKLRSCDDFSLINSMPRLLNYSEEAGRLRLAVEEQLQKLKDSIHTVRYLNSNGRLNSFSVDVDLCSILPHARTDEKLIEKLQETDEEVDSLRKIVEQLFAEMNKMLYSVSNSAFERRFEDEFRREINALVIRSSVKGLRDEFETKLHEQGSLVNTLSVECQQKFNELSTIRGELDSIFRSLSSSDSGPLLSHKSLDSFEEPNAPKWKEPFPHHIVTAEENGTNSLNQSEDCESMLEVADSSHLKHLSRDEVVDYYKTEMIKMRRQHESALHRKTEELFRLKREFLREKGSSLFKKDREFELLKKRIPEIIVKLDGVLLEKEKLPIVQIDHEELCNLRGRINDLLSENQQLRSQLKQQREKTKGLSSQISDAASQMLLQIKKLQEDLLELKAEASFEYELYGVILKGIVGSMNCGIEDLDISAGIMQDIYVTAVRGIIADGMSTVNSTILNYLSEKSSLLALVNEKDETLHREIEEKKELKQTIASLSSQMQEKEKYELETGFTLVQQKGQLDLLDQEIKMLREKLAKQEGLISNIKTESYSTKKILDEALQQIRETETEIKELNRHLKEAEEQNSTLRGIIEDKEKELLSCFIKEKQQAKELKSIFASLMGLSTEYIGLENKLMEKIGRNETRLKWLSKQWHSLMQQSNLVTKRAFLYKQMLEIRSSNLQKAEAEVDLLGDEVDALLSLLGKIYIALDHYSPVLQHYPGVMEILKLVQRELEGETAGSV